MNEHSLADMALWLAPSNVTGLHCLTLPLPDREGFAWHRVRQQEPRAEGRGAEAGGGSASPLLAQRSWAPPLLATLCLHCTPRSGSALTAAFSAGHCRLQVAGVEVRPGQRATIYTDAGAVVTVEAAPDGSDPTVTLNSTGLLGGTSGVVDMAAGVPVWTACTCALLPAGGAGWVG